MSRHFTTIKRQPTAGMAIFVKKCVFFIEIQDFHCVCLYVDDFLYMCVAKPPLDVVYVSMCFCYYWSVCGQAFFMILIGMCVYAWASLSLILCMFLYVLLCSLHVCR